MKILQLTKKFPWPEKDGEVIGILNLTLGFSALGHQVTVLALNTHKHYFPPDDLPPNIMEQARFISVPINTDIQITKAFFNLFTTQSYNITRFFSPQYAAKLQSLLKEETFDLILVEGVYLMQYVTYIPDIFQGKILFRPQNVEHIIWERLAQHEKKPIRRMYLSLLAQRMKSFELRVMNSCDLMVTVSEQDLLLFKRLGFTGKGFTVPTGYRFDSLPDISSDEERAVGFIGGMDWMPNREGIEWFLEKVWPVVIHRIPEARFYLAGRNFPDDLKAHRQEGVEIVGEVEDARQFILSKSVSVCPLFAGSGMRVKIVEAMALGRAIVSTSIGAESLAYAEGKDILIADNPELFAEYVIQILEKDDLRLSLGTSAQQRVRSVYDNRVICQQILNTILS